MHHDLKCIEPYFSAVKAGRKPFEIRNNDRNFMHGDTFTLHQYDDELKVFNGDSVGPLTITYITSYEQRSGYVVFSWMPCPQNTEKQP